MRGRIHIGTSGWHYEHWRGPFYPEGIAAKDMLAFYAEHFSTVEVNNSFYRLPGAKAVEAWRDETPSNFIFACKASRYTTHVKRLKDAPQSFEKFFPRVDPLGKKLGPILFQTPPRFPPDPERLAAFVAALPQKHSYAFEFRDERWFIDEVREVLTKGNCAFCIFDFGGMQSPMWTTADFAYLRLHGPGAKYQNSYGDKALRDWADQIHAFAATALDVYCYFDNDQSGYAPQNALHLLQIVGRKAAA